MKINTLRRLTSFAFFFLAAIIVTSVLCSVPGMVRESYASDTHDTVYTARPSVNGPLHVNGISLEDESGRQVALRGISTHGLTWYPDFVDETLFHGLSANWNCNLIRLAMYSDLYCGKEKEKSLALMEKGIEAAIASDQYVLVDWHILSDSNPNQNIGEAIEFFRMISEKYSDSPNILYEICNEPNGNTQWEDVETYADQVIPVIRANSPKAVIIVGTPNYDRDLESAALRPLSFENVMYAFHFYTATHKESMRNTLEHALMSGLPVFITECGLSEESGDGKNDFESASAWFGLLKEYNLSYAVWSFSNKDESSAMIKPFVAPKNALKEGSLTQCGLWVKALISGEDPAVIPVPAENEDRIFQDKLETLISTAGSEGILAISRWPWIAACVLVLVLILSFSGNYLSGSKKTLTYDDLPAGPVQRKLTAKEKKQKTHHAICRVLILISTVFSLIYLVWRVRFSLPLRFGWAAVLANLLLLAVEILGFVETLIHYESMSGLKEHPLPKIPEDSWPEVDIFIATYNEPEDLLRRTINGCQHLRYPDPGKVHVWVCDDNRRPSMRALANEMGVGYFDRPDNKGAKAGNLNHAMALTHAPYIVTFDADMIPRSDFLMNTIPYFVDARIKSESLPEGKKIRLGLLQTPQCFYDPDVFQHALYSEYRVPNEQDFFYRTIEAAKTSTNSVIYGGSNTVLSREALEAAGGFYTESITEDFATGMLIESAGFVSLGLSEPLASGRTPHTFREHIKQRTRWGRGVIVTARKLKLLRRKGLTFAQKLSYWSSVVYWYSPIKNLIYLLSPLMFAVLAVPVFRCSWLELLIYWLPMFVLQEICLRTVSGNTVSSKWSGIYETSVMPHLLIPILKESLGITMSAFKVTDKTGKSAPRKADIRYMIPFFILIGLSVIGIIRVLFLIHGIGSVGILVLLFWLIRNLYYMIMSLFLMDGRDSDGEPVHVRDAEILTVERTKGSRSGQAETKLEGVTTHLTEHSIEAYLDIGGTLSVGDFVTATIDNFSYHAKLSCVVTGIRTSRSGTEQVYRMEILDFNGTWPEYLQILYDRIPSLPQSLSRDLGILPHLWNNLAYRMARTTK